MVYSEQIIKHYHDPLNVGSLGEDEKDVITVFAGAPACGDVMKLQVKIKDGVVADVKHKVYGCASAIASSSVLTEKIRGKKLEEVLQIDDKELRVKVANELELPPAKIHCSLLAGDAFVGLQKRMQAYVPESASDAVSVKNSEAIEGAA